MQENLKSSANMRKSRVNFREAEVSGEVSGSRASLRSGNDLSKARAAPRAEAALSIKEKIDLVRSSVSVRGDHAVKSNAEMRKSLASLRMEQSTYSLRSLANDELPEIGKWSEVEKSCLSLKSAAAAQEPAAKPKNIFDDEDFEGVMTIKTKDTQFTLKDQIREQALRKMSDSSVSSSEDEEVATKRVH